MFTGIVSALGDVLGVTPASGRLTVVIRTPYADLRVGESVAVNGACLTVVRVDGTTFAAEVIGTTRSRTCLDTLIPGDRVNLERAVAVGERFGGHFVQGHVDGVGHVLGITERREAMLMELQVPVEVWEVCIPHGSIAVDGVSLTINALPAPNTVEVALISFTLAHTTLGRRRPGDAVHIEGDMLGKYARALLTGER